MFFFSCENIQYGPVFVQTYLQKSCYIFLRFLYEKFLKFISFLGPSKNFSIISTIYGKNRKKKLSLSPFPTNSSTLLENLYRTSDLETTVIFPAYRIK